MTRAEGQAGELCAELEARGAIPVRCATILVAPPSSFDELDAALSRLDAYRWLVFTSANGVRSVVSRMEHLGMAVTELSRAGIAAVGSSTARALTEHGVDPSFVPEDAQATALATLLSPVAGERVLLARADIADPAPARILRRRGAEEVDDVVAYRTAPTAPDDRAMEELRRGVHGITFTSPSTVRGFAQLGPAYPELLRGTIVATLGPVTTAAAREAGVRVSVEAEERTMRGLVEALASAFAHEAAVLVNHEQS